MKGRSTVPQMSMETDTDGLKVPEEHEQQLTGRVAKRIRARSGVRRAHGDARPLILGVCCATDGRTRRDAPQVLVVLFRPI